MRAMQLHKRLISLTKQLLRGKRKGMIISRDTDGLRFIGSCDREKGFVSGDIQCLLCGRRIDPYVEGRDISLGCNRCGTKVKSFWSEADMHVFLAENWALLRKACTHPSVTMVQRSD
ncbi:MAG: hypothetical protein WA738_20995 [Candidatus Angelobacter sp.]